MKQWIRESTNGLKTEFYNRIKDRYPNYPKVRAQAIMLRIGDGTFYKGDCFCASWPRDGNPAAQTVW